MAIQKKSKTNFLGQRKVEDLGFSQVPKDNRVGVEELPTSSTSEQRKGLQIVDERQLTELLKKAQRGRPRKNLVQGDQEKKICIAVPVSLLDEVNKIAKTEHKSIKELLIVPAIEKYLKIKQP